MVAFLLTHELHIKRLIVEDGSTRDATCGQGVIASTISGRERLRLGHYSWRTRLSRVCEVPLRIFEVGSFGKLFVLRRVPAASAGLDATKSHEPGVSSYKQETLRGAEIITYRLA